MEAAVSSEASVDVSRARAVTAQEKVNLINKCDNSKGREKQESMERRRIMRANKHKKKLHKKATFRASTW